MRGIVFSHAIVGLALSAMLAVYSADAKPSADEIPADELQQMVQDLGDRDFRVNQLQGGKDEGAKGIVVATGKKENQPGPPAKTISQVLVEFLDDQKGRISPKTFRKYQSIIDLYKLYLENYWPGHDSEYAAVTKRRGTYCGTYGPEDATQGFWEFREYFMPRKVLCGQETIKAATTVTKKLEEWLIEKGYITETEE